MKFNLALIFLLVSTLTQASSSGEVKILYPCEALDLIPREKEMKGIIVFLETKDRVLNKNGLILRKRKDLKESDVTIKMRWAEGNPTIDPAIQNQLSQSVNGELKCELDVGYHPVSPKRVESCSFKSEGHELYREHTDFLKMVNSKISQLPLDLNEIKIESVSWKIPLSGFKKKPNLELWKKNDQCLLEASAKFDNNMAIETLNSFKAAIKAEPSPLQISKTGWALGL